MAKNDSTGRDWPDNMRPAVAAEYLAVSDSKLAKLRMVENRHEGPAFVKISGCVIYRRTDLDEWLERHLVRFGIDKDPHVAWRSSGAVPPTQLQGQSVRTRHARPRRGQ
jgi:hypothetical protein